jgi:hypothetical protein
MAAHLKDSEILNMVCNMKTISLAVSEEDYEGFRLLSQREGRPIARIIREAMSLYLAEQRTPKGRLEHVRVFPGVRQIAPLPTREELWDEIYDRGRTDGE